MANCKISARRKAREWTLQFLFSIDVEKNTLKQFKQAELSRFWDMMMATQEDEMRSFPESRQTATDWIRGISDNLDTLDEKIARYVKNWTIDRMAVVDRNIMRLATYEMFFCDDIPTKVSINEAIEIAKSFADVKSKGFINGILDKVKIEAEKAGK